MILFDQYIVYGTNSRRGYFKKISSKFYGLFLF
jgi:hypothetical protein